MSEKHENRAETIERAMVIDLDRRRVTTLARLVGMLSIMAGDGPEIDGYDAAQLHAEASMALGIEDADDIDGMAADIVEHGPDAHLLTDRLGSLDRDVALGEAVGVARDYVAPIMAGSFERGGILAAQEIAKRIAAIAKATQQ